MANTVDTLNVRIDADLRPLRRALKGTQRSVQQTSERMKKSFSGIGQSVTALGKKFGGLKGIIAGAFVGATVAAGAAVGRTAAEFQDLQQTLDTVFGSVRQGKASMQFIQKFAQTTPFDIQTLSKAFIQLKGAGIDPTVDLLNTFGDAASATTNKVQAFETMVRIATRAVGGGLGLEELEQLVGAGIPVYQILQDEIGVTRTEISEMGQTAEGATKIMDALQTGLNKRFGGGMEKSAKNLSTAFSNMKIAGTNLLLALGDGIGGTGLTGAFTFLANTMSQLFAVVKPLAHVLGTVLGVALRVIIAPLRLVTEAILFLAQGISDLLVFAADALPDSFTKIKEAANNLNASLSELEAKMNGVREEGENVAAVNTEVTGTLEAQAAAAKKARAELNGFTSAEIAALEAAGLLTKMNFSGDGITMQPIDLTGDISAVLAAVATTQGYQDQLQELEDEKDRQAKRDEERAKAGIEAAKKAKEIAEQIAADTQAKFQDISSTISNSLADALVEGKSVLDSLKNVFRGFVKTMIAKAIELMVVNRILNAVFGLTGGSALPMGSPTALAGGGSVSPNQPYVVGERGPELFVPSSSGTVMNNSNSKGFGGGSTTVVNQTINVSAGVSQTVRAEMISLLPSFKQETMSGVADAKRRGGSYGRAFG
tara:strand:+ start:737 stop:2701 length:1965 start_codon:yes stop_codon:yes gene_type:complete